MAVKKSTTAQAKKPANAGKKLPGRPVKDLTKIPEKKNALKEEQKLEKNAPVAVQSPVDNINFNVHEVADALNNVNTDIKIDNGLQEIVDKIEENLKPIQEMKDEMKEISERQSSISKEIQEHPERTQEIVSKEIQKAEALKDKLEKALEKAKPQIKGPTAFPTQWWNGVKID